MKLVTEGIGGTLVWQCCHFSTLLQWVISLSLSLSLTLPLPLSLSTVDAYVTLAKDQFGYTIEQVHYTVCVGVSYW